MLRARIAALEGRLEATERELFELTHVVSHDLRAPLRHILGFAQVLQEDYSDGLDSDGRSFLRMVRQGAERVNEMVTGLVRYARLAQRPMPLSALDAAVVVADTIEAFSTTARLPEGSFEVVGPAARCRANRAALVEVIEHLLSNALHFATPDVEAPLATISTEHRHDSIRISISDRGSGVRERDRGRIFEPLARLGRPEDSRGAGMGLALARRAVLRMDGSIEVSDTPGGRGATFTVILPAA